MAMMRSEALTVLQLQQGTTDAEAIKKAFRKLAVEKHPDKYVGTPEHDQKAEEFKKITEAYERLTKDEKQGEVTEFSPSWLGMMQDELKAGDSSTALVTADQNKPTITGFFLSLKKKLFELEKKVTESKDDEFIEIFEGISIAQQQKNREYVLKCIRAANNIAQLLEDHIKTRDPNHWKIQEQIRFARLAANLMREFSKFGANQHLDLRDAHTLELAKILLDHLAYLRKPLRNFKSTEDQYHLMLLDDISERLREYHNIMLVNVDEFNQRVTIRGGYISEILTGLMQRVKQHSTNAGQLRKEITQDEMQFLWTEVSNAREYVFFHCRYPDSINIFNPNKDRTAHRNGILGSFRDVLLNTMLLYNNIPGATNPFSTGYSSMDEYYQEVNPVLQQAQENQTPAHLIPTLGKKFIDANKQPMALLCSPSSTTEVSNSKAHEHSEAKQNPAQQPLKINPIYSQLLNRKNELLSKFKQNMSSYKSNKNDYLAYIEEEKQLALRIDKMVNGPVKDQTNIILTAFREAIACTTDVEEIKRLTKGLTISRKAINDPSLWPTLRNEANTFQSNPSSYLKKIGLAMLGLCLLLAIVVDKQYGFGIQEVSGVDITAAASWTFGALLVGAPCLFYAGHKKRTARVINDTVDEIIPNYPNLAAEKH